MQLNSVWGDAAIGAGFGAIQDLSTLIDFLIFGDADGGTVSSTVVSATGTLNGQSIHFVVSGVGLDFDTFGDPIGNGTVHSVTFYAGTSATSGQEILTLTGDIAFGALGTAIRAEDSGQDTTAVEDFFSMFDWVYEGTGATDLLPSNFTSPDGTPFSLNGDDDLILAGGDDIVFAGAGHDVVDGDRGNDNISGGNGNDDLSGDGGNDTVNGNNGNDTLLGGKGNDQLNGGGGRDRMVGQAGSDTLKGGAGDDVLNGGGSQDLLNGDNGNDFLKAGTRSDVLNGGKDNDRLFGNRHDDTLNGGNGNDTLNGGGENDRLNGGAGNDVYKGGSGADEFHFSGDHGSDTIVDFTPSEVGEVINLSKVTAITDFGDLDANHMSQSGQNVVIDTGGGNSITLLDVSLSDLDSSDFIF